jgi:hypothetical protein
VKIVIYGQGKSGTSALFYKVKNSLPPSTIALFEPTSFGMREQLKPRLRALARGAIFPDILAKVLPCDRKAVRLQDFDSFDRQVLIIRDPRDRMVSGLLYRSYHAAFDQTGENARAFLDLLRRKEGDPLSVSLLELVDAVEALQHGPTGPASWLPHYQDQSVARPMAFHRERPHLHLFRYEDMVDGRFEALEAALRLPLKGSATVPQNLQRVVRSKGYGAWRHWFTPEDVTVMRPILQPYLDSYYPGAGWDLSPSPKLEAAFGSEYVRRVMNERRVQQKLPLLDEDR